MADERRETLLLNRNKSISPDHTAWIKEQFSKGSIISAHGREVWVKAPGRNLSRIVNIPNRDSINYKAAWVNVYNLCLDYLEGMINSACIENRFIQRMGNVWTLNGHVVIWPRFSSSNADYARGLEKILEEYIYVKGKYIQSMNKNSGIQVKKSSVAVTARTFDRPISTVKMMERPISPVKMMERPKVSTPPSEPVRPRVPQENAYADSVPVQVKTPVENVKPVEVSRTLEPKVTPKPTVQVMEEEKITTEVKPVVNNTQASKGLVIQKISDGDTLNNRDYNKLKENKPDIILLTCKNILNTKEEDIFLTNARNCLKAGLKTGAFIYGHAVDEHDGASELKVLLKILSKFSKDFSGLIIYSVDEEYIKDNQDDEKKILDYINVYNAIITTLKRSGYMAIISMGLESSKIIEDVMNRNNMGREHVITYMVVVRDVDELRDGMPRIIVDPWNDYDTVILNNAELENSLRQRL